MARGVDEVEVRERETTTMQTACVCVNEGRFTVNLIRANGVGLCGKVLVHVVEGGPISVAATTPTQAVYEA